MKNVLLVLIVLALSYSSAVFANKATVEVWQCKLKEGKTMKDAAASNEKWVKFMNAHVEGGGINSYDLAPRVGNQDGFMFVDVYPSLKSWAASENVMDNKEGKAIIKEIKAIAKCSSNTLYSSTKH